MVKASPAVVAAAASANVEAKASVGQFASPRAPFRNVTDAMLKRILEKQCGAERVQAKLVRRVPAKAKAAAEGAAAADEEAAAEKEEKEPATIKSRSKLTNRAAALMQVLLGHDLKEVLNGARMLTRAAAQTCQGPEQVEASIHSLGLPYRFSEKREFSAFDPDEDRHNKTLMDPAVTLLNALRRVRSAADRVLKAATESKHRALPEIAKQHATIVRFYETVANGTSKSVDPHKTALAALETLRTTAK